MFSLKGSVKYTWALHSQTQVVIGKADWDKVSTIGVVVSIIQFLQQTQYGVFEGLDVIRSSQRPNSQIDAWRPSRTRASA